MENSVGCIYEYNNKKFIIIDQGEHSVTIVPLIEKTITVDSVIVMDSKNMNVENLTFIGKDERLCSSLRTMIN